MMDSEELHRRIFQEIDLSEELEDEELVEIIYRVLEEYSEETYLSLKEKTELGKELFNTFRKLDVLQEFLEDESITEVMINGTQSIFLERDGRILQSEKRFASRRKLEDVIQQIVSETNRMVNESTPIVDTRLSDGSRVNVVLYPIALNGPIVTIRKFTKEIITLERLQMLGAINKDIISFLKILIKSKYNIFISGGTGSGKTTFLNALSQYIPNDERVITIEDNAELKLAGIPNLVSLEARTANVEGKGEISIRDLIRTALRMRPDRIIVGEVRGKEAIDMLQAMNTGHDGSLSTGHANSPGDMISRLETMVLMGMDLPLPAIQRQIASGLDILIHLGRLRDKSRKVLSIEEIVGCENGTVKRNVLYRFQETGIKCGKIEGKWVKENEMKNREKLLAEGYQQEGICSSNK